MKPFYETNISISIFVSYMCHVDILGICLMNIDQDAAKNFLVI